MKNGLIAFSRNKVRDSSGVQLRLAIKAVLQGILDQQDHAGEIMFGEAKPACKERAAIHALSTGR